MSVERQDGSENAGTTLGQVAKLPGTSCPKDWDTSGTTLCKWLKSIHPSSPDHSENRKTALNALVLLGETTLQLQLRMVCALRSPGRAKQTKMHLRPDMGRPFAFPLGSVFGIVVAARGGLR